jgi:hypothetical protein
MEDWPFYPTKGGLKMKLPEFLVKTFLFFMILLDWLLPDKGRPEIIEE